MLLKTKSLPEMILRVLKDKGTEPPFSSELSDAEQPGSYLCRLCGLALFRSATKFHSQCGWPSFDEEIKDAVATLPDQDGRRTEIVCARCQSHLGHIFSGEGYTKKNTRHCVNGVSLDFTADMQVKDTEEAIFAGGCFWGLEYLFQRLPGVVITEVGYAGGLRAHSSYEQVCSGATGHVEALRVVYDIDKLNFTQVAQYFFEIHDPTQIGGQGPDIGSQYESVVFYYDDEQKQVVQKLIAQLESTGMQVATTLRPMSIFWPAEAYHQRYYEKNHESPYCHFYQKRFE